MSWKKDTSTQTDAHTPTSLFRMKTSEILEDLSIFWKKPNKIWKMSSALMFLFPFFQKKGFWFRRPGQIWEIWCYDFLLSPWWNQTAWEREREREREEGIVEPAVQTGQVWSAVMVMKHNGDAHLFGDDWRTGNPETIFGNERQLCPVAKKLKFNINQLQSDLSIGWFWRKNLNTWHFSLFKQLPLEIASTGTSRTFLLVIYQFYTEFNVS